MPSKTNTTYASYYKRDLQMDQSNNSGADSTLRRVQSGDGADTSIYLSDDNCRIKPSDDRDGNSTTTLAVQTAGGSNILAVDTSNEIVKCGGSQINALTMYQYFRTWRIVPVAGSHMVLSLASTGYLGDPSEFTLGAGNAPATTLDVSGEVDTFHIAHTYWYLPDAITVDAVHVLMGGDTTSTTDNLNFNLHSYAVDTGNGAGSGDLTDGTLVAGTEGPTGSFITDVHEDAIKYQSLANTPTDVAAGRVILATVESTGTDNVSVNMTVKYHIQ